MSPTQLARLWHHGEAERVTLISLSIANGAVILSTARSLIFKGPRSQKWLFKNIPCSKIVSPERSEVSLLNYSFGLCSVGVVCGWIAPSRGFGHFDLLSFWGGSGKAGRSKERFSGSKDITDAFLRSSACIGCFHHLFFYFNPLNPVGNWFPVGLWRS